ncbi:hypothetical protein GmHk_01G001548 [Glycine max]|nr:hypothetical protein GmHk_01G001548 [Glycine max]
MVLLCDRGGFVGDGDGAIRLMGLIGEEWSEKTKMQQRRFDDNFLSEPMPLNINNLTSVREL